MPAINFGFPTTLDPYYGIQAPPLPKPPGVPLEGSYPNLPALSEPDRLLIESWNTYLQNSINFFNQQDVRNSETTPALVSLVNGDLASLLKKSLVPDWNWTTVAIIAAISLGGVFVIGKVIK